MRSFAILWRALLAAPFFVLPAIAASADGTWPERYTFPNRYEGFPDHPNRLPGLALLSFTADVEPVADLKGKKLKVAFFLDGATATINATPWDPDNTYRMESRAQPWTPGSFNTFPRVGDWPTDLLQKAQLSLDRLGVVVRLGSEQDDRYAPAYVFSTAAKQGKPASYTVVVRPGNALKSISYEVHQAGVQKPLLQDKLAGKPERVAFPIQINATALPVGPLTLSLYGEWLNEQGGPAIDIQFKHLARAP